MGKNDCFPESIRHLIPVTGIGVMSFRAGGETINNSLGVQSNPLHSFSRVYIDAVACPLAILPKYLELSPQRSEAAS